MKTIIKSTIVYSAVVVFTLASCTKNLDRKPYVQITSETVYDSPENIKSALAKVYGGFTLSGQGQATLPDIATQDVGSNVFLRNYFEAQELTTDEAIIGWNDHDLLAYHNLNWTADGYFDKIMYDRVFFEVAACNEFIREVSDAKIAQFPTDSTNLRNFRNEARFLRALSYWIGIDMFGNIPFTTDADPVGLFTPPQKSRADVFAYVESELKQLEAALPAPGANEYGRADQGAVWTLLANLYLNSMVYTGTDRNTDAITYCNKIINSGAYSLASSYQDLFEIKNNTTKEIIFPLIADGLYSQSYGNTSFIVHASIGGNMNPVNYGIVAGGGWGGLRTTSALVGKFDDPSGSTDKRAMFFSSGQTLAIKTVGNFNDGYAINKYKNIDSAGHAGSDPTGTFVDTDFPFFRLGDVYLMYAEAVLRGGTGGDKATAVSYINQLRERAYGNANGDIRASDLNLDFILDERARELYWEGHRRTDLIRFGKFTSGSYLWPYKGGVEDGTAVDDHYNLFPLSNTDRIANPNLVQNSGY